MLGTSLPSLRVACSAVSPPGKHGRHLCHHGGAART
ncbi:hypothetical protein EC80416_0862, partial [Escherichia coli 8.0416]